MRLTLITAPDTDAVELVSAKRQCRVDHNDDDAFIGSLIGAATQHLDAPHGILGRAVMPQIWLLELIAWQEAVVLPVEPVRSVLVTYIDASGDEQTLDPRHINFPPGHHSRWNGVLPLARCALPWVMLPIRCGSRSMLDLPMRMRCLNRSKPRSRCLSPIGMSIARRLPPARFPKCRWRSVL